MKAPSSANLSCTQMQVLVCHRHSTVGARGQTPRAPSRERQVFRLGPLHSDHVAPHQTIIRNASRICVSSLRRGHANLLCIVPILVYVVPKLDMLHEQLPCLYTGKAKHERQSRVGVQANQFSHLTWGRGSEEHTRSPLSLSRRAAAYTNLLCPYNQSQVK